MRFRVRDYAEEEGILLMRRHAADCHPLSSPPLLHLQPSSSFSRATIPIQISRTDELMNDILLDPLRPVSVESSLLSTSATVGTQERSSHLKLSKRKLDQQAEAFATEWEDHGASILRRFTSGDAIKVSSSLDAISKQLKGRGKSLTSGHLEELHDVANGADEGGDIISQQDYVTRLRELNDNIAHAWLNNERVATLKLAVKVAKLLKDTSVPRFYPTLFILVTDVLDTIGKLVWKRIKGKAELDDNGNNGKFLPENFTADDVCQEAKDTCTNWFYKIGSIHELLPRIYLEIAILHCMHFLQKDPPIAVFQRLNIMIRGLADPLAAAYAHLYLARKGQRIVPHETGYLIMGLDDYLLLYRRVLSGNFERAFFKSGLDKPAYASLVEPVFELYLQYICSSATKEELLFILKTFCEQHSGSDVDGKGLAPVSVLVHHVLRQFPAVLVSENALDWSRIVKRANDCSKAQYLNYRLLGIKLCECNPSSELRLTVLNDIWKAVLQLSDLVEYLTVVDVFVEYVLECCSEAELNVLLCDILKHLRKTNCSEEALRILESIVMKILEKLADIKQLITTPYFVAILDKFYGDLRYKLHKQILLYAVRNCQIICDPVTRHFVFELSKSLYKSMDSTSSEDERRQIARLISRFVHLVDFKQDLEQHFSFLVDCRGTFHAMDILRETVVHASNRLAIAALKIHRERLTQQTFEFVKTCLTFNETTIPCLQSIVKSIFLYIETAEVAMMSGLVSHAESVLRSSITCLQELGNIGDARNKETEIDLLGCIQKMCSFLIIFPGHLELGTFYFLRGLLHAINTEARLKEPVKTQALLGVILACNALAQPKLPYHVNSMEVFSNDELFLGELSYLDELAYLSAGIVKSIITSVMRTVEKGNEVESIITSVMRTVEKGNEVLAACEVFAITFEWGSKDNDLNEHFTTLAKVAKPLLSKRSKALNFVDSFVTNCNQGK